MAKYIVINGIRVDKDYENFVPETFGRLTTIGPRFRVANTTYQVCQCRCQTKSIVVIPHGNLMAGVTKSCGCLLLEFLFNDKTTHGRSNTAEYRILRGIVRRCYKENCVGYPNYGGRGIRVCDRWLEPNGQGFLNFLEDMGPRPGPEYSVDRYPNPDGNYEPGNCRWATTREQAMNRRTTRMLTVFGRTQCGLDWAKEYGIPYSTLLGRLNRGWSVERAITEPRHKRESKHATNVVSVRTSERA